MTRRQEIIATLLEWYEAVLHSWQDGMGAGDYGFPRICPVLNHPSYLELERLLPKLRTSQPIPYWNLAQRYWLAPSKPVLRCAVCGPHPDRPEFAYLHPKDVPLAPFGVDVDHKHGQRLVTLRPARVKVPSFAIRPELVQAGIEWLDENWQGMEPFVPDFEPRRSKVAA